MATEGERDRLPEMGRIRDKRKMREKKGGVKNDGAAVEARSVCDKHMRKEERKFEECEDITREEVYRDLWRVSIGSEYRKVVARLSGRYGDRDKCSLKGPTKEQSGDTSSTNRRTAIYDEIYCDWIDVMRNTKYLLRFFQEPVNPVHEFMNKW